MDAARLIALRLPFAGLIIVRQHNELICFQIVTFYVAVFLRHHGQPLRFQMLVQPHTNQIVNHREQRHADDHTDEPEYTAEEQQREGDPEFADAGRRAENLRAEDIAVDLLQDNDKDNEKEAMDLLKDESYFLKPIYYKNDNLITPYQKNSKTFTL